MQQLLNMDDALHRLLDLGASDLLLSCGSSPRIRKDGNLEPLEGHSRMLVPSDTQRLVREILDPKQLKELEKRRHVDFSFTWRDRARIRGKAYHQRNSIAASFRLLPLVIPSFEMLGIPESVHRLMERYHGLILVTGPTGSGKSTTQAAMIDHINATRPFHVITIEDPIEYVHNHRLAIVDQRQVGEDTPSFAEGLRAAFREDPDVVLIGEMRDLETISAGVSIAESGHLVLATLHTNDVARAAAGADHVPRLHAAPPYAHAALMQQLIQRRWIRGQSVVEFSFTVGAELKHESDARGVMLAAITSLESHGLANAMKVMGGPRTVSPTKSGRDQVRRWKESWRTNAKAVRQRIRSAILEELEGQRQANPRRHRLEGKLDLDALASRMEVNVSRHV